MVANHKQITKKPKYLKLGINTGSIKTINMGQAGNCKYFFTLPFSNETHNGCASRAADQREGTWGESGARPKRSSASSGYNFSLLLLSILRSGRLKASSIFLPASLISLCHSFVESVSSRGNFLKSTART